AADSGADEDATALLLVGGVGLPARIVDGLLGRGHGEDDEIVDLALLLGLHPIVGIELALAEGPPRHEAADLAGEIVDLEFLDAARPALARDKARPARLDTTPQRRHETESGDDDASQHEGS